MTIAIIMACHNRKTLTIKCLSILYRQKGINTNFNIDVFLLDDASVDGTSQEIRAKFPNVRVIDGNGNLFWNRGMHTAWKAAIEFEKQFDSYLWLNDDTFLLNNGIEMMLKTAKMTNFNSIICGSISSPKNKTILTYGGCTISSGKSIPNIPNGNYEIADTINGNCVLIPHSVYEKVGNLDWTFIHAMGDNDYSLRAKKIGILSYSTGDFVGNCSDNNCLPKWCDPHFSFKERCINLYSPIGNAEPFKFFIFQKRHFGITKAVRSFLSTHFRLLFPKLWLNKNN
jgi:GT2 family glycosyltransferase